MQIMLKKSLLLVSVVLLARGNVRAQSPPQENQRQPQQEHPQKSEPVKPPRMVGEAREKEEYDAWQTVQQAGNLSEKAELARLFLETYPDSGLTAFAHRALAEAAYQQNDVENLILHGEKALRELPETAELLAELAFIYSERREILKATDYANRALQLLDQLERPAGMSSIEWVTQIHGLRVSSYYALGRSHLEIWNKSDGSPTELQQAVDHLTRSLEMDPEHAYAAFRLGFARANSHDAEAALAAYARACVVEGPAAGPSRMQLERIHKNLQRHPESRWLYTSIEEILQEERNRLEAQMAEKEQKLARLAAELDSAEQELEQDKEVRPPEISDLRH